MKAREYLKLNRTADRVLVALDEYLNRLCGIRYDWEKENVFDIPLIRSNNYYKHRIYVNFNLPSRKVKYWIDGNNVEVDNYYGYDDNELATAIFGWEGRDFLGEFDFFI